MPNPLPIIAYKQNRIWLIDGRNGKFYLWQDVEDFVGEVYERNLAIILSIAGLKKTKWRRLGHLVLDHHQIMTLHRCKLIHFFD